MQKVDQYESVKSKGVTTSSEDMISLPQLFVKLIVSQLKYHLYC